MNLDRRHLLSRVPLAVSAVGASAVLSGSTFAADAKPSNDTNAGSMQANAPAGEPGAVTPQLEDARRHMLDADVSALTFHSMDQLFYTRPVKRSGPVWVLPRNDKELIFKYSFAGQTYAAPQFLDRNFGSAMLVMKGGKIVHEAYRNFTDHRTHFISFSMAKSLTSILMGLALHDGYLHALSDPVVKYVPELKGSGYDGVSLLQIMQMRSGVAYDERYDFNSHSPAQEVFENALVRNIARFADMAPKLKRGTTPGSRFNYSTMDTAVLGWVLDRALKQPLANYMTAKLWGPLGMESDGFYIADGALGVGRELNGMGFNAVLRDYGRIGLMMLQNGRAMGTQVVPAAWVAESTRSVPIEPSPHMPPGPVLGYGYQWWTLPESGAYLAIGLQGQFIFIDQKTDTVIVKLSYYPPGDEMPTGEAIAFFLAASRWRV